MIGVEMGILICIFPLRMSEYMLSDGGASYAIELCCSGMPEEMGVEVFMDGEVVGCGSKYILKRSGGDSLFPF